MSELLLLILVIMAIMFYNSSKKVECFLRVDNGEEPPADDDGENDDDGNAPVDPDGKTKFYKTKTFRYAAGIVVLAIVIGVIFMVAK